MFGRRRWTPERGAVAVAIGAAAGLAAGAVAAGRWWRGRRSEEPARMGVRFEDRVAEALRADEVIGARPVNVAVLSEGIVELSGTVATEEEADRTIHIAQAVPGVDTVLNRMDIGTLETHLAETRARHEAEPAELHERHWYGMRVGMGQRRQGHETDPDRPDEKVPSQTRDYGIDRMVSDPSDDLEKVAPAVEHHTTGPAAPTDRGTVERAPHRRLGNVPPVGLQVTNPQSRVHENVKKGTELRLEESGADRELARRRREEREERLGREERR